MSGAVVMSLKKEMKKGLRNVMKDVELEASKEWTAMYGGHKITVKNGLKEEVLLVDDVAIAEHRRTSLWSHVIPYVALKGRFTTATGQTKTVTAKVGGYFKFNCMIKVDGQKILSAVEKFEWLPWKHKEPIVPFIQQQLREHGQLVTDELPDDSYVYDEDQPRLAPGMADRMNDELVIPFFINKIIKLLTQQMNNPTDKARAKTYEELTSDTIASYGDYFIEKFQQQVWDEQAVQREAIWLLENGADREVVKFALVLLGCTSCDAYRSLLCDIGRHEEFTSYAAFALERGCESAEEALFELAQQTDSWGRVSAIEHLQGATDEIRAWLLTEGYQIDGLEEYVAFECIDKGQLVDMLAGDELATEQFEHANILLQYLLSDRAFGGSIEDIDRGADLLTYFVKHATKHCLSLDHFYTLTLIERFLEEKEDDDQWQELYEEDWITQVAHHALQQAVQVFTNDRKWLSEAVDVLDERFDNTALEITSFYELNIAAKLFEHLRQNPRQIKIYNAIIMSGVQGDVEELCQVATEKFLFDALSEAEEACLQSILEDLYAYDVTGLSLIEKALTSSSKLVQLEALTVLGCWDRTSWENQNLIIALKQISEVTDDSTIRKKAKKLLK